MKLNLVAQNGDGEVFPIDWSRGSPTMVGLRETTRVSQHKKTQKGKASEYFFLMEQTKIPNKHPKTPYGVFKIWGKFF